MPHPTHLIKRLHTQSHVIFVLLTSFPSVSVEGVALSRWLINLLPLSRSVITSDLVQPQQHEVEEI